MSGFISNPSGSAPMTGAAIKAAYESQPDTNALTDAALTKLNVVSEVFPTVAAMVASALLVVGDFAAARDGYNGEIEVFEIVAAATHTANAQEVINLTGISGQAVSTRKWFKSFTELIADTRVFADGVTLAVSGLGTYSCVSAGHDLQNAGAQGVTVNSGPDGSYNIRAFGAVGDGVADDAAAINLSLGSNRKIVFPEGDYLLGSTAADIVTLTGLTNVELYGAGGVLKLANNTPVASSGAMILITNCSEIWVRDLKLDGNASNNTSNTSSSTGLVGGVTARNSDRVNVSGCSIQAANNNGIYFTDGSTQCIASGNLLKNNFGTDLRSGLPSGGVDTEVVFSDNVLVLDTNVHPGTPKQDGLISQRWGGRAIITGNTVIIRSTVTDVPASLVWLGQVGSLLFANNTIISEAGGSYAIQGNLTANAEEIIISNNEFASEQGLLISGSGGPFTAGSLLISGNKIETTAQSPLIVDQANLTFDEVLIQGNVLVAGGSYAASISGGNISFVGNVLKGSGSGHALFVGGGSDLLISSNDIDVAGSTGRAIECYASDSIISGNRTRNLGGQAIKETGSANWNHIHGNHTKGGAIVVAGVNSVAANNI